MTGNELVTYDGLPASAGGAHSLRTKDRGAAWRKVQRFVDACARPASEPALTFQLWSGGPPDVTERLTVFAAEQLGGPRRRAQTHTEWGVPVGSVDTVLEALGDAGAAAVTRYGHPLASLVWSADVLLLDPATGLPYEGITPEAFGRFAVDGYGRLLGTSGVRAAVGTTASSLSLRLSLPGDERVRAAAAHIEDGLPFRLSAKHWRRWRPTRDGSGYYPRKIPSPLAERSPRWSPPIPPSPNRSRGFGR